MSDTLCDQQRLGTLVKRSQTSCQMFQCGCSLHQSTKLKRASHSLNFPHYSHRATVIWFGTRPAAKFNNLFSGLAKKSKLTICDLSKQSKNHLLQTVQHGHLQPCMATVWFQCQDLTLSCCKPPIGNGTSCHSFSVDFRTCKFLSHFKFFPQWLEVDSEKCRRAESRC